MSQVIIEAHKDSKEYLYFPFTSSVDVSTLSNGQIAFNTSPTLPDVPTWIDATIVEDEPSVGTDSLRILLGTDWQPDAGYYYWWGRFTDTPETPLERGPGRVRIFV